MSIATVLSFYFNIGNLGERLDNYLGGNPNSTFGQIYGVAPGVGGYMDMVIHMRDDNLQ
ncbi:hypothetical protein I4U23_011444 [Adineta vaga]|nr:hypothetical protein I4U23_011444 [Adineta vaga]